MQVTNTSATRTTKNVSVNEEKEDSRFVSLVASPSRIYWLCIAIPPILVTFLVRCTNPSSTFSASTPLNTNTKPPQRGGDTSTPPPDDSITTCQFYLAESSIPNAGLGIYTSIDLQTNDIVAPPDLVLRILDFELHNEYDPDVKRNFLVTKEYAWSAGKLSGNGGLAKEANRVSTVVPGLGMITNCHMGLRNVAIDTIPPPPQHLINNSITGSNSTLLHHRSRYPGVGAFTSHHNISHTATKPIKAGSELFNDYGTRWFRQREAQLGVIPFAEHYLKADRIVRSANDLFRRYNLELEGGKDSLAIHVWELLRRGNVTTDEVEQVALRYESGRTDSSKSPLIPIQQLHSLINQNKFTQPQTRMALPETAAELPLASHTGTARHSIPHFIRTPSWLEQNGLCLDNLRTGDSTSTEAGRGAFAQRLVRKGETIAPAPLLHIPYKRVLDMYALEGDGAYGQPRKVNGGRKEGRQLLLNYCYGHENSTLLLFPYSSVVNYINHDRDASNAELRWSLSKYHHREWMNWTVEELEKESRAGLMAEYVATRDIAPGEEVYIDYGEDWDRAWRNHVERWEPLAGQFSYRPAWELNQRMDSIKTVFDRSSLSYYPSNIDVTCYYDYTVGEHSSSEEQASMFHHLMSSVPPLPVDLVKLKMKQTAYQWENTKGAFTKINRHPCNIITKSQTGVDGKDLYMAIITQRDTSSNSQINNRLVTEMPRKAIVFQDKPYTSDQQLPNAFRHAIAIPDDMFPSSWMNI